MAWIYMYIFRHCTCLASLNSCCMPGMDQRQHNILHLHFRLPMLSLSTLMPHTRAHTRTRTRTCAVCEWGCLGAGDPKQSAGASLAPEAAASAGHCPRDGVPAQQRDAPPRPQLQELPAEEEREEVHGRGGRLWARSSVPTLLQVGVNL